MQNDISDNISDNIILAPYIDHTLLKADASLSQIQQLCAEARQFQFFSVCVNSFYVKTCSDLLKASDVKICSVVGFPLGAMDSLAKAYETERAIYEGGDEIDMVINIGALKNANRLQVQKDIEQVVSAAAGKTVKVIIETALLTSAEKVLACQLSEQAGAHFVKTCTGFGGGGATVEDITLMRKSVSAKVAIKASGGIKDRAFALALIQAGANRLGTSSGIALVQGQNASGGY